MKKISIYLFGLANLSIIFYFWAVNSWHLIGTNAASTNLAMGRLSGLLLVAGLLLQFLIMSRAPFLEQTFGLDKLSYLHHFIGKYLVIIFLLGHTLLLTFAYAGFNETTITAQYFGFLKFDVLPKAVIAQWLFIFVIIYSILMVIKKWNFEKWYYAHLSVYIALILAFGHQLELGGDFGASQVFTFYWYALYAFVAVMLVVYRFGMPLLLFYKHRFFIETIVRETHDVTSIYITGNNMEEFKFQPGQFIIARFLDKERRWQAHPFSLSQPFNGKDIRLSIKSSGDFTSQVSSLKSQVSVLVEGPYGIFTANKLKNNKALLIAGGIGVTPIRGIVENLGENKKEAILLYANKTEKDIALREEIETLGEKYNLPIHHILSSIHKEGSESPPGKGRMVEDQERSNEVKSNELINIRNGLIDTTILQQLIPDINTYEVFLCGPPPMMAAITKTLINLGVPKQNIYFEKFSL